MDNIKNALNFPLMSGLTDVLDILLVAFIIYKAIKLIKNTPAGRLIKGIFFLIIIMQASNFLNLNTMYYILKNTMQMGLIAIVVVFQPELRKFLEQVGKSSFNILERDKKHSEQSDSISHIVNACSVMSKAKIGALIVIKRKDNILEYSKSSTVLDANITSELIQNIFFSKAPLHDGGVIIENNKIYRAGAILPLSKNPNLDKELGTRHRAAVGTSEQCDALCIVVSEENGAISISMNGMLKRRLSVDTLTKILTSELIVIDEEKPSKLFGKWRKS